MKQVEGQWDEVLRHADQFVGQRVRITVVSDGGNAGPSMRDEIRKWLAEGDILEVATPANVRADAFSDGLVEKFRKQGLVI